MAEQHQQEVGCSSRRALGLLAAVLLGAAVIPPRAPDAFLIADDVVQSQLTTTDPSERRTTIESVPTSTGPRLIDGDVADALVLVRGGAVCSGTPITGTRYVATAAHCVLDPDGRPARRTVVRDGVTHQVAAVWVDTRYTDDQALRLDAAILELDRDLPGPSAAIGPRIPDGGSATIAGYQPIDTDGTLLRGEGPHDRPVPQQASGPLIIVDSRPAGCTARVDDIAVTPARVDVSCGLIPGASGGGLFVHTDGVTTLVGIISTVAYDLSFNGVVPIASVTELLRHPERYRYSTDDMTSVATREVRRS